MFFTPVKRVYLEKYHLGSGPCWYSFPLHPIGKHDENLLMMLFCLYTSLQMMTIVMFVMSNSISYISPETCNWKGKQCQLDTDN